MTKKIRVGILFGGRSAEHEVSISSAKNVAAALDPKKYQPVLIYINKSGSWLPLPKFPQLNSSKNGTKLTNIRNSAVKKSSIQVWSGSNAGHVDVLFPVLHGSYGEDGTVQGLAKLLDIPCVGAGVLGSSVGMDKDVSKRLLRDSKIPTAKFLVFHHGDKIPTYKSVAKQLKTPFFVKPANLGSSVGVTKVKNTTEYKKAIKTAFEYDVKIIIEENIIGREVECSVLGNQKPIVSVPGEVKNTKHEFYDYQAKYSDDQGVILDIPAKFSKGVIRKIQDVALKTYSTLEASGMARVDMFVTKNGKVYINEINTIPGFTKYSMYPKLWEYSGISQTKLIDRLITFAIDEFNQTSGLKVDH